jgi:hypothetical protein
MEVAMYGRKCLFGFSILIAVCYSQAQDSPFDGYWVGTLQFEKMQPADLELQVNGQSAVLKLKLVDAGPKSVVWGKGKVEQKSDMVTVTYEGSTDLESFQGAVIRGSLSGTWGGGNLWEGETTFELYETKWRGPFRLKKSEGEITGQPSK